MPIQTRPISTVRAEFVPRNQIGGRVFLCWELPRHVGLPHEAGVGARLCTGLKWAFGKTMKIPTGVAMATLDARGSGYGETDAMGRLTKREPLASAPSPSRPSCRFAGAWGQFKGGTFHPFSVSRTSDAFLRQYRTHQACFGGTQSAQGSRQSRGQGSR